MLGENRATLGTSLSSFRTLGMKRRATAVSEKGKKKKSTMKESESKTASNDIKAGKHQ